MLPAMHSRSSLPRPPAEQSGGAGREVARIGEGLQELGEVSGVDPAVAAGVASNWNDGDVDGQEGSAGRSGGRSGWRVQSSRYCTCVGAWMVGF